MKCTFFLMFKEMFNIKEKTSLHSLNSSIQDTVYNHTVYESFSILIIVFFSL